MKKFTMIIAMVALLVACGGGGNDDPKPNKDGTLDVSVNVTNASDYTTVATVKVNVSDPDTGDDVVIAQKAWTNGKFTINLPIVADTLLSAAVGGVIPTGLTVSDSNVRTASFDYLDLYDADDVAVDEVYAAYLSQTITTYERVLVEWIYADVPTTVTGTIGLDVRILLLTVELDTKYDLSLKKGWNIVYRFVDLNLLDIAAGKLVGATSTVTSKKPSVGITWVAGLQNVTPTN